MLTENTANKLQEMKLTAMARAFKAQLTDPDVAGLSFEDRFGLLVDQEWISRKNNHLKRLIKNARFSESGACVEDIEYHTDRNLDKAQIARLAACITSQNITTSCYSVLQAAARPILPVRLAWRQSVIFLRSDMSNCRNCLLNLLSQEETAHTARSFSNIRSRRY